MFPKKLVFTLFFCAVFFINQQEVLACTCEAKRTVLDAFESSQTVLIAKVVSVEKIKDMDKDEEFVYKGIKSTKMVVEKVYKGDVSIGDELVFRQGMGGDCIWTFDEDYVGERFLFYLDAPSKGHPFFGKEDKDAQLMYYAITCGRSRPPIMHPMIYLI
jgi:hypothetical protein